MRAGGRLDREGRVGYIGQLGVGGCAGGKVRVVLEVEGEGFGVVIVHVFYYARLGSVVFRCHCCCPGRFRVVTENGRMCL